MLRPDVVRNLAWILRRIHCLSMAWMCEHASGRGSAQPPGSPPSTADLSVHRGTRPAEHTHRGPADRRPQTLPLRPSSSAPGGAGARRNCMMIRGGRRCAVVKGWPTRACHASCFLPDVGHSASSRRSLLHSGFTAAPSRFVSCRKIPSLVSDSCIFLFFSLPVSRSSPRISSCHIAVIISRYQWQPQHQLSS